MVAAATIIQHFFPKIQYQFEEDPITVKYVDSPLVWDEPLHLNSTYEYIEYNASDPAIILRRAGNLTIGFKFINSTHFTEFTVEVWNVTATPQLVGSFNMTSEPLTFESGPAKYGYAFYFTTAYAPNASGIIELDVMVEFP